MIHDRGEVPAASDRARLVLTGLFVLLAAGAWQCSDLSVHKPGDESVSVPLDRSEPPAASQGSRPGPAGVPKPSIVVAPTTPSPRSPPSPPSGKPTQAPPPVPAPSALAQPAALTPRTDPPSEARALSRAFANVARALGPSVVRVDVEVTHPGADEEGDEDGPDPRDLPPSLRRFFRFGPPADPGPQRGTGSGIVLDGAGDIVTNRHVVAHASKVNVIFPDGRELSAKVVGTDSQTDVAVVRLDNVPAGLVAARLGDSDKLDVGEWVLAVGSPLGLDQTVTAGIVSGKGRVGRHVQMSGERVRRYIQTDAKINPGNSGGPLVNLGAEVVGINTLINTGPGGAYGFAIPINQVRRVAEALIRDGRVRYPYLGVLLGDVKELEADKRTRLSRYGGTPASGAFVNQVTPSSPAARAGLRADDIITEIDGQLMEGAGDVIDYVSTRDIGAKVQVAYVREGKKAGVPVVLAELPSPGGDPRDGEDDAPVFGLTLQTLTPRLAESLGLPTTLTGAVIVEVSQDRQDRQDRRDRKDRLSVGDVIVEIDRRAVSSAEEAKAILRTRRKAGHVARVRGKRGVHFVTIGEATP